VIVPAMDYEAFFTQRLDAVCPRGAVPRLLPISNGAAGGFRARMTAASARRSDGVVLPQRRQFEIHGPKIVYSRTKTISYRSRQ
jgi:hypothetical protein